MNSCTHSHFLVTEASSGIGRATALRLVVTGHHVFAGIRKPEDGAALRREASDPPGGPGEITPLTLDVTDGGQIRAAAEAVAAHWTAWWTTPGSESSARSNSCRSTRSAASWR